MSARRWGGPSTSAWSRNVSTKDRKASRFTTGRARTTAPSGRRSSTASAPTWWTAHGACSASTSSRPTTGGSLPSSHGCSRTPGWGCSGRSNTCRRRTSTAPTMRSTRKLRAASRPWSWPERYQRPRWKSRRSGSTTRSSSPARPRRATAAARIAEHHRMAVDEGAEQRRQPRVGRHLGQRRRGRVLAGTAGRGGVGAGPGAAAERVGALASELPQRLGGALQADDPRRQVQRRQLVGRQARVAQVVLLGGTR